MIISFRDLQSYMELSKCDNQITIIDCNDKEVDYFYAFNKRTNKYQLYLGSRAGLNEFCSKNCYVEEYTLVGEEEVKKRKRHVLNII